MPSIEFQREPTMTKTAQRLYIRALTKLFRTYRRRALEKFAQSRKLQYEPTDIDIEGFTTWTEQAQYAVIIRPGRAIIDEKIPNIYASGLRFADIKTGNEATGALGRADWRAIDALKVRNLSALKGITAEMNKQIIREITDGMQLGEHPTVIAKRIADRVDKIGLSRAQLMARTEVINAFNQAALTRYSQHGVEKVRFYAALDERTCDVCGALHNQVFDIASRPPNVQHPNCRCTYLPEK